MSMLDKNLKALQLSSQLVSLLLSFLLFISIVLYYLPQDLFFTSKLDNLPAIFFFSPLGVWFFSDIIEGVRIHSMNAIDSKDDLGLAILFGATKAALCKHFNSILYASIPFLFRPLVYSFFSRFFPDYRAPLNPYAQNLNARMNDLHFAVVLVVLLGGFFLWWQVKEMYSTKKLSLEDLKRTNELKINILGLPIR